jgi:hypothetical protein
MKIVEAVNRDEIDALETLKETNEIITTSLQNDLLVLQKDHKNVTTDFEQQKTHLLETLLAKEQLMKDLADARGSRVAAGDNAQLDEKEKAELQKSAEVSHKIGLAPEKSLSARRKVFKKLFHPFHPSRSTPKGSPAPTPTDAELAAERFAIGAGPPVVLPVLSPRTIPLPMSPAPVKQTPDVVHRFETQDSVARTDTFAANSEARARHPRPPTKTQSRRRKHP